MPTIEMMWEDSR